MLLWTVLVSFPFLFPPPPPPPPICTNVFLLSFPFFPSPNICFLEAQAGSAPLVGNFPWCIQNLSFFLFFLFFCLFTIGTSFYGLSVVLLENDYRKNIIEVEFIFSVRAPLLFFFCFCFLYSSMIKFVVVVMVIFTLTAKLV